MEKEADLKIRKTELPFAYHTRKSSVMLREVRHLYNGCKVNLGADNFEVTMPSGRMVFRLPFEAIEREAEIHYLPLEEILRKESMAPLGPCGYIVPFLLAKYYGLIDANYGAYPCNMRSRNGATSVRIVDIDKENPEYILLYSESKMAYITPDKASTYQRVRIGRKYITLIFIPVARAAQICSLKVGALLDSLYSASCNVQEVEWNLSRRYR